MRQRQRGEMGAWSPWNELSRLRSEINRIFESKDLPGLGGALHWVPSVDVHQDKDRVMVKAELPGFKRQDIAVSIEGDTLTLSGERTQEQESPEEQACQSERFYGRFERQLTLPEHVDADKASATYKDGVLCIYLPKTEQSRRKHIQVQSSEPADVKQGFSAGP